MQPRFNSSRFSVLSPLDARLLLRPALRCDALQCVAMRCILREKGINYIKFNRSIHCHALGAKGAWRGRDQRMVAKTVDRPVRREA